MATKSPDLDAETKAMVEQARATVQQEIAELKKHGISIYYREYPGGPLIQELPDGSKQAVAPPVEND